VDGAAQEFRVCSVSNGIVEVEEFGTGSKYTKHESHLKLMPKVFPSSACLAECKARGVQAAEDDMVVLSSDDDAHGPLDGTVPWTLTAAKPDGGCLYRCFVMGEAQQSGEAPVDDDEQSWAMRRRVLADMEAWVSQLSPLRREEVACVIKAEMEEDPTWPEIEPWNWESYFVYAACHDTFSTSANICAYTNMSGIGVQVFQRRADGRYEQVYDSGGLPAKGAPIRLLRHALHFDLITPVSAHIPPMRLRRKSPVIPKTATTLSAAGVKVEADSGKDAKKTTRTRKRKAMEAPGTAAAEEKVPPQKSKAMKASKRAAPSVDQKQAKLLAKRIEKDAPFGRCMRTGCQAALKPIPPRIAGGNAMIACPRYPKLCFGCVRPLAPKDLEHLPPTFVRRR